MSPLNTQRDLHRIRVVSLHWSPSFCQFNSMVTGLLPWVPETFLALFPVSVRPTPKIPAAREKNLWYPGYRVTVLEDFNCTVLYGRFRRSYSYRAQDLILFYSNVYRPFLVHQKPLFQSNLSLNKFLFTCKLNSFSY